MAKNSQSGIGFLVDALRQSGVNVEELTEDFGEEADASAEARAYDDGSDEESASADESNEGSSSGGMGGGRTVRGGKPFGGFSFMGNEKPRNGGGGGSDGGSGTPPVFSFGDSMGSRFASWNKRTRIVAIIVAILVLYGAYWWFHPPISINSTDTWLFVLVFIALPCWLIFRTKERNYTSGTSKVEPDEGKAKTFKRLSYLPFIVALIPIIGFVLSLSLFPGNAYKYANVLKTVPLDFASDIQPVNYKEIPVIDHDSAVLLGNREMGSIPDYVSQFEVDDLYSQINYQGTPVRVSPLGYADLFKWFTNREEGIPAYALVDMTTQDAQIVRLGEGNGMKYTASEPLARNIDRYIQLKYPFYIFDEKSFEIDEDGQPWWICPVRKYTIGLFGGETIDRVILCNASTGECEEYMVEDVPQWVDRVYPAELLIRQYNWSGAYQNGWFNSWLGQSGVVQTTPGTNGLSGYNYIAKDDDVWVYTGVTSATSDSSIVGFVLIDQRTAESHYYSVSGATEVSAMGSAEGQVQNLRYTSTFPLLINVADQPTYFMALKDSAGLVKKFAMIDIQRYQNVAIGDTVAECQREYEKLLVTNGTIVPEDTTDLPTSFDSTSGRVRAMTQVVIDGNTHFYVMLEGDDAIYDFALPNLVDIVTYEVGDEIEFTYAPGDPLSSVSSITEKSGQSSGSASAQSASSGTASSAGGQSSASGSAATAASEGSAASASADSASTEGESPGDADANGENKESA